MIKAHATSKWAKVSVIVCVRDKMFPTDKKGECAECGHTIYYSEVLLHYPADVKKVCVACSLTLIDEQETK